MKDYRQHGIATLFGRVTVRLPRFRCAGCETFATGVDWPPHVRSTPELDRLRAQLSALLTYRTAADLLAQMFPVDAGAAHETLRRHTFKIAEELPMPATLKPATPVEAITVTLDATFIRGCEDGERHLEVRIGNVETATGGRQVFGAVAKTDTDLVALIRGNLDAVGRAKNTVLTALTDGCPGLRRVLLDVGITKLPILDWFHLAMRLQQLTRIAGNLPSDNPERAPAKAVIVEEVEPLRWRLWNGKAKDAGISIDRIRAVIPNPADQCAGGLVGVTAGHQAKWVAALITSGMSARVRQRSLSAASRSSSVAKCLFATASSAGGQRCSAGCSSGV